MRAKRQILSLLLVLLLVWQGFSFANAETGSTQGIVGSGTGTEASAASSNTISGTGTASSSTISGASSASKTGKAIENAIYDPEFLIGNDKDNPLKDGGGLGSYQFLQFKAKIKVQGLKIEEGDYISIQLPKQLRMPKTTAVRTEGCLLGRKLTKKW